MRITLVKKVQANGEDCRKCKDVMRHLKSGGYLDRIDRILVADERNPDSAGWLVARHYGVDTAPFFVVKHEDGREQVYTIFHALLHEILQPPSPATTDKGLEPLKEPAAQDGLDIR